MKKLFFSIFILFSIFAATIFGFGLGMGQIGGWFGGWVILIWLGAMAFSWKRLKPFTPYLFLFGVVPFFITFTPVESIFAVIFILVCSLFLSFFLSKSLSKTG